MELHWFTDGSHSWLRVPRKMVFEAGLASQVSRFSYEKRLTVHGTVVEDVVFLEEDCDAPLFINTWRGTGMSFDFVERNGCDAFGIRDLPRFDSRSDVRDFARRAAAQTWGEPGFEPGDVHRPGHDF